MKSIHEQQNKFMSSIRKEVWTQLCDRGIDYNFVEMKNHFIDMMLNTEVSKNIVNVFLKQFECDLTDEKAGTIIRLNPYSDEESTD